VGELCCSQLYGPLHDPASKREREGGRERGGRPMVRHSWPLYGSTGTAKGKSRGAVTTVVTTEVDNEGSGGFGCSVHCGSCKPRV